jgi:hypothetical protein
MRDTRDRGSAKPPAAPAAGVSRSSSAPTAPAALSSRPTAGWSNAPSPGSAEIDASPEIPKFSPTLPRPSSTSPSSSSCCGTSPEHDPFRTDSNRSLEPGHHEPSSVASGSSARNRGDPARRSSGLVCRCRLSASAVMKASSRAWLALSRIAMRAIAVGKGGFADLLSAADAFGDVLASQLEMHPAGIPAFGEMDREGALQFHRGYGRRLASCSRSRR